MTRDEIAKLVDADTLLADGYEDAVIGVLFEPKRVIYSSNKIVEILKARDDMAVLDAWEFFYFNIKGAYMGPKTPVFMEQENADGFDD